MCTLKKQPHLLYIGQMPTEGMGSPVIVLRHLHRLSENGYRITIIAEYGDKRPPELPTSWNILYLPYRRKWWPPYKADNRMLRRIRIWLLARECRDLLQNQEPDAILSYLAGHADFSAEVASELTKQTGWQLTVLIHDDAVGFSTIAAERKTLRSRHTRIIQSARKSWFVSQELRKSYATQNTNTGILLPLPEGAIKEPAVWSEERVNPFRVYYAGFIWPAQYPLFRKMAELLNQVGMRLVIQSRDTKELRSFLAENTADWITPFSSNREALEHLKENASALLVSYAEKASDMPWIKSSFPSKLAEYAHLGLPCAIVAPVDTAVARWARENKFADYFEPQQLEELCRWYLSLKQKERWQDSASRMLSLAKEPFAPDIIHKQFESELFSER